MENEYTERPLRPSRRRWLRSLIIGIAILLCGIIIGSGVTFHVVVGRFMEAVRNPGVVPSRIAARLEKVLDLNEEQAAEVESIVGRHQKELIAIGVEVRPRVRAQFGQMKREIEAVLTPEQAERFQERTEFIVKSLAPRPPQ